MRYGASNQVVGKVTKIKKGAVMCQVELKVDGPIDITSVRTVDPLEDLGIKKGDRVRAVLKAIHVLLVRE